MAVQQPQSENLRRTQLKALQNLAMQVINPEIVKAYDGRINRQPSELERDKKIRDILRLSENDTVPEMLLKVFIFYIAGNKLPSVIEEHIAINKRFKNKDPNRAYGKIRFKTKEYIGGKNYGYVYLTLQNVNVDKYLKSGFKEMGELSLTVGSVRAIYTLQDQHQIKLNTSTQKEAHRVINSLLPFVKEDLIFGSSEEHTYFGTVPPDMEKLKLEGKTLYANQFELYDPNGLINGGKFLL